MDSPREIVLRVWPLAECVTTEHGRYGVFRSEVDTQSFAIGDTESEAWLRAVERIQKESNG